MLRAQDCVSRFYTARVRLCHSTIPGVGRLHLRQQTFQVASGSAGSARSGPKATKTANRTYGTIARLGRLAATSPKFCTGPVQSGFFSHFEQDANNPFPKQQEADNEDDTLSHGNPVAEGGEIAV